MSDIQELNKLDKVTLWSILVNQVDEVQTDINSMVAITEKSQLVLEKQQSKLQSLLDLMDKLNQEDQLQIPVKDYLTEEQYQDYLLTLQEPEMLCDFGITLLEWLDWFYQELPYITDKYLTFTDIEGKTYTLNQLDYSNLIQVDHTNRLIYIQKGIKQPNDILIDLNGISLYDLLNVSYTKAKDKNLVDKFEPYNE